MTEATPSRGEWSAGRGRRLDDPVGQRGITNRGVFHPATGLRRGGLGALVVAVFLLSIVGHLRPLRPLREAALQERYGQQLPCLMSLGLFFRAVRSSPIFFYGLADFARLPGLAASTSPGVSRSATSFIALWLALALYTSAFIADFVLSGILAVSKGQTEAAFLRWAFQPNRTMQLIHSAAGAARDLPR